MKLRPGWIRIFFLLCVWVTFVTLRPLSWFIPQSLLVNRIGFSQAAYDSSGRLMRLSLSTDDKFRLWVPLHEISGQMINATLSQEDSWFYYHPGINPISLIRAIYTTYFEGTRVGGSTITMQLARLRYGLHTRSIQGKISQILYSLLLELSFSKDEILEAYLNLAPYGQNIEGIGAAARIYFGKAARHVSQAESITLSVIPQHPSSRVPLAHNDLTSLRDAETRLKERMFSPGSLQGAVATQSRSDLPNVAPHLTTRLFVADPFAREIHTTIRRDLQSVIERLIRDFTDKNSKLGIKNASAILVDVESNEVVSYVGSAGYLNRDIEGFVDGVQARRSPGSALKPFIYALGMEKGLLHPGSVLKDTSFSRAQYNPENYERDFVGPISATDALIRSRNIPAVILLNQLLPPTFLEFLRRGGVREMKQESFYGLSIALGGVEVRLDEIVNLYAMLARGGSYTSLKFLQDTPHTAITERLLSPEASRLTLEMLSANPRPQTYVESHSTVRNLSIPWKTGTSYSFRDAWAVGIVGRYALGIWVGNFDGRSNAAFIGREAAGPLFFSIADGIFATEPLYETWRKPGLNIKKVQVCALSGQLPGPSCGHKKNSWFIPGKSPIHTCIIHRKVSIDPVRGVRTCAKSLVQGIDQTMEFWPSDLAQLYQEAGLPRKMPPPYAPECVGTKGVGSAPNISSPSATTEYVLHSDRLAIPLSAVTDADSKRLYWFVDDAFVGEAVPGQTIFWKPTEGKYLVRVVDEQSRSNEVVANVIQR